MNIWSMLDCILSQNCRNTLLLHVVDQLACHAKNERLMWLAGIKCVKTQTYYKQGVIQNISFGSSSMKKCDHGLIKSSRGLYRVNIY